MESNLEPMIDLQNHPVFTRRPEFDFDRYVYHYTRWERLLDIAHTGLRLGSLARMNDPRESKDWYLGHTTWDDQEPVDSVAFWKAISEYKRQIKNALLKSQPKKPTGLLVRKLSDDRIGCWPFGTVGLREGLGERLTLCVMLVVMESK
jgi:hypothetical protein